MKLNRKRLSDSKGLSKMKKKMLLGTITLASVMLIAGCGNNGNEKTADGQTTAKSKSAAVSIKSGSYILPGEKTASENEGYLALEVSIKNNTKDTLDISSNDIALYDEDDNKISEESIYTDDSAFKKMSYEKLSGGKTANGYIVFKVEKDKKYELHYSKLTFDEKKKEKDIELKIDPKKYQDPTEDLKKMTETYVNQVFLGKAAEATEDSSSEDKQDSKKAEVYALSNNLEAEHTDFKQKFADNLKKDFDYYEPSAGEVGKVVDAYKAANQKKAKVTYQIAEMFPGKVTVYVKPETINFDDVDTDSISEKFVSENKGKYEIIDYDKIYQDAEKFILQQLPAKFDQAPVSTPEYMKGEGYKVKLTKENGKWTLDSSDTSSNYGYNELKASFMGGLND